MERVIEIIKEWGFKSGIKGHYYKFVTPDSYVRFYFEEDYVTITFIAFCGTRNEELTKVEGSHKMDKTRISESDDDIIKLIIKGIIWRLAIDVHGKYLFNE